MRIGIDARLANAPRTGIGSYTAHLVAALARAGGPGAPRALCRRPARGPPGCEAVVVPGRSRHVWTFGRLPLACRRAGLDLFHGTANFAVPALAGCPLVATVHDLIRCASRLPFRAATACSSAHSSGARCGPRVA